MAHIVMVCMVMANIVMGVYGHGPILSWLIERNEVCRLKALDSPVGLHQVFAAHAREREEGVGVGRIVDVLDGVEAKTEAITR